jgi:hypothetical protein
MASSVFWLRASSLISHLAGYGEIKSQWPDLRLHPTSETNSYPLHVKRQAHDSLEPQNRRNKNDPKLHFYSDLLSSAPLKQIYTLKIIDIVVLATDFTD